MHEVVALPWTYCDPIDRLMVAQVRVEGLFIISRDRSLSDYGVPIV
jgi:PIN domain nuclease of toxin-antitoxin system